MDLHAAVSSPWRAEEREELYGGDLVVSYADFLASKTITDPDTGLATIPSIPGTLKPFQADITRWALKRGRAAIFAGTGLGKSFMEMVWADALAKHTEKPSLIFTPLAVAAQFVTEGAKWGIPVNQVRQQSDIAPGVNVTNYDKIEHFDLSKFGAVVLDESSILKSVDGSTRTLLIERCKTVPFRLAASATPAPNDFMELGNHAEFLGVMSYTDMLSTFFMHDSGETQAWRLRGHAEKPFWRWMCSWAVTLRKPSDLGYDDAGYILPPLNQIEHKVAVEYAPSNASGLLFPMEAQSLSERLGARRGSIDERVAKAAEITPADRQFFWWCHLNAEADALQHAIPGAVDLRGSDHERDKERKIADFISRKIRVLISKPGICGYGLNLQMCADTGFVGLSDSFEQVYQAVRRFWRFGQTKPVNAHFIAAETEGAVVSNIRRKEAQADHMVNSMIEHMRDLNSAAVHGMTRDRASYVPTQKMGIAPWLAA